MTVLERSATVRLASLFLENHQRARQVDLRLFRRVIRSFLVEVLDRAEFELDIYIVNANKITQLNEHFLQHRGSTDVITFDYALPRSRRRLHGEIFICLPEAVAQARQYRVTWQEELVRYAIHGILHLCGFDDRTQAQRREMKRNEDSAVRYLAKQYYFPKLGGPSASSRHGQR